MKIHTHPRSRAFTFAELCIGMVVTALVLSALAAFSLATAEAWTQGATTNNVGSGQNVAAIPVIANLASARLESEISGSLETGGYFPGNLTDPNSTQASLMLWKKTQTNDTSVDASEIELIEYDPSTRTIYKYLPTVSTPATNYTLFNDSSWIATFKATATKQPLARNVDGMQIYVQNPSSATQLPLVEYRLYFSRGGHTQTRYGAVCLRSPTTASPIQVLN